MSIVQDTARRSESATIARKRRTTDSLSKSAAIINLTFAAIAVANLFGIVATLLSLARTNGDFIATFLPFSLGIAFPLVAFSVLSFLRNGR